MVLERHNMLVNLTANGNLLEESHINSTTPGIGVNESIDSLFNYGTWNNTGGIPNI